MVSFLFAAKTFFLIGPVRKEYQMAKYMILLMDHTYEEDDPKLFVRLYADTADEADKIACDWMIEGEENPNHDAVVFPVKTVEHWEDDII